MMGRLMIAGAFVFLGGCGKEMDLKPAANAALPRKPATAATQPTAAELLTPSPEAQPKRVDELLTRSKPRGDDKFDLPPPG